MEWCFRVSHTRVRRDNCSSAPTHLLDWSMGSRHQSTSEMMSFTSICISLNSTRDGLAQGMDEQVRVLTVRAQVWLTVLENDLLQCLPDHLLFDRLVQRAKHYGFSGLRRNYFPLDQVDRMFVKEVSHKLSIAATLHHAAVHRKGTLKKSDTNATEDLCILKGRTVTTCKDN